MESCWVDAPAHRPDFKRLCGKLEAMWKSAVEAGGLFPRASTKSARESSGRFSRRQAPSGFNACASIALANTGDSQCRTVSAMLERSNTMETSVSSFSNVPHLHHQRNHNYCANASNQRRAAIGEDGDAANDYASAGAAVAAAAADSISKDTYDNTAISVWSRPAYARSVSAYSDAGTPPLCSTPLSAAEWDVACRAGVRPGSTVMRYQSAIRETPSKQGVEVQAGSSLQQAEYAMLNRVPAVPKHGIVKRKPGNVSSSGGAAAATAAGFGGRRRQVSLCLDSEGSVPALFGFPSDDSFNFPATPSSQSLYQPASDTRTSSILTPSFLGGSSQSSLVSASSSARPPRPAKPWQQQQQHQQQQQQQSRQRKVSQSSSMETPPHASSQGMAAAAPAMPTPGNCSGPAHSSLAGNFRRFHAFGVLQSCSEISVDDGSNRESSVSEQHPSAHTTSSGSPGVHPAGVQQSISAAVYRSSSTPRGSLSPAPGPLAMTAHAADSPTNEIADEDYTEMEPPPGRANIDTNNNSKDGGGNLVNSSIDAISRERESNVTRATPEATSPRTGLVRSRGRSPCTQMHRPGKRHHPPSQLLYTNVPLNTAQRRTSPSTGVFPPGTLQLSVLSPSPVRSTHHSRIMPSAEPQPVMSSSPVTTSQPPMLTSCPPTMTSHPPPARTPQSHISVCLLDEDKDTKATQCSSPTTQRSRTVSHPVDIPMRIADS